MTTNSTIALAFKRLIFLTVLYCSSLAANEDSAPGMTHTARASKTPVLIIDDIACRGNVRTDCAFITNKFFQSVGDVLDSGEIADARLRLGTLIQLKSVDIYLEKGHKRNHVVVVFEINEASNLFWEVGAGYSNTRVKSGPDFFNIRPEYGINTKVTNFNFLGTGKELSLAVSATIQDSKLSSFSAGNSIFDEDFNVLETDIESEQNTTLDTYQIRLSYFDPHLYGSPYYYLAASLQFEKFKVEHNEHTKFLDLQDTPDKISQYHYERSYYKHSLILGRRFGSYSYVALDITTTDVYQNDETSYGITYGWNSEDDQLLPTKGSHFTTRWSKLQGQDVANLNFRQNISVRPNQVVSFGTNITYNEVNVYCTACPIIFDDSLSASIFGRFTNIQEINSSTGEYRSWSLGLHYGQGNISEDLYNYHFSGVNAGYSYQTDSIIYRFSLAYHHQENR